MAALFAGDRETVEEADSAVMNPEFHASKLQVPTMPSNRKWNK